ncbi:MAG: hypothetical protein AAGG07_05295 [Planctomycetota bacterium]
MTTDAQGPNDENASPALVGSTLPKVRLSGSLDEAMRALETASKRGRMAGFAKGPGGDGPAFHTEAYAHPFERRLDAFDDAAGDQVTLRFETHLLKRMPLIWAAVLILTVWPGWPLTHDILSTYSDWYASNIQTWWWYIPLMILGVPGIWKLWKRSAAQAHASALEMIGKIAAETGGEQIDADA